MITLLSKGLYRLVGADDHTMMLYLGTQAYHLGFARGIGYLLTFSKHPHAESFQVAHGRFRIYAVEDEPLLVDLEHLELEVAPGKWQGYLLLTGLPTAKKLRSRIEPTHEVITKGKG